MISDTHPPHIRHRDVKSQTRRVRGQEAGAVQQSIFATLSDTLRTLSHTLGNPLAGLSLTLELLAGTALKPNQARYVERCLRVAERLNLHKDLWGRLGLGKGHEPFAAVDVLPIVDEVLHTLHLGHSFHVEVDVPEDARQVHAHEGLLQLALMHLLRNASEALGSQGTLGVRCRRTPKHVCISVWDEGPGLSPSVQDALWIRPIPGKAHAGGMGLFWVAAIVESVHLGTLSFTPKMPHGAAFHIELDAPPSLGGSGL